MRARRRMAFPPAGGRTAAALLLAAVLLAGSRYPAGSCGPDFPNWLLVDPLDSALAAPRAEFELEVSRLALVSTRRQARPVDIKLSSHPQDTLEAELADLGRALDRRGTPAAERDRIVTAHRAERAKIQGWIPQPPPQGWPSWWNGSEESLRPKGTNQTRIATNAIPQATAGLPGEFADYLEGSVAWHRGDLTGARRAWTRLLERPPAERLYKSTWAAHMLGRSWEEEDGTGAMEHFRRVRALADAGYADSLGLAVASLGYEARLLCRENRLEAATDLYLEQVAAGDRSALLSLRYVARRAVEGDAGTLQRMARHPRAQRLVTAWLTSGGSYLPPVDVDGPVKERTLQLWTAASAKATLLPAPKPSWHNMAEPVLRWLEAVEKAGVRDMVSAEHLALAAYQGGAFDLVQRWLQRAPTTPLTQWLQAKLLLRNGQIEQAAALLAVVSRQFPTLSPPRTNPPASTRLADHLWLSSGDYLRVSMAQEVLANQGLVHLARRQFVEALDALLRSTPDYWMDAAYVAERVLTLEELRAYVDRAWPAPAQPAGLSDPQRAAGVRSTNETILLQSARQAEEEFRPVDRIRYLLGRRLARTGDLAGAEAYFPEAWRPLFERLRLARGAYGRQDLNGQEQGWRLIEAGRLLRRHGMELIGTEVEPDWRIHAGNYEEGITTSRRAALVTNGLPTALEEMARARQHGVKPEERWHYREVGRTLAREGLRLVRETRLPDQSATERAQILFAAARFAVTNRVGSVSSTTRANTNAPANPRPRRGTEAAHLWADGQSASALAWEAAELLPDNQEETASMLCEAGCWTGGPENADLFYKALVRRCGRTALGAAADRQRWFPKVPKAKVNPAPALEPPAAPAP